jgi:hypothetical protein
MTTPRNQPGFKQTVRLWLLEHHQMDALLFGSRECWSRALSDERHADAGLAEDEAGVRARGRQFRGRGRRPVVHDDLERRNDETPAGHASFTAFNVWDCGTHAEG